MKLNKYGLKQPMPLLPTISLRVKLYVILTALVVITFGGGFVMVWYTYRTSGLLKSIIERNLAAFNAAEALEAALVHQKGFVSYYFMDGDPDWLKRLGEYRQIFRERLSQAYASAENDQQKAALNQIAAEYIAYVSSKDQVIDHYKAGRRKTGTELHYGVRNHFFRILEMCESYKKIHSDRIQQIRIESEARAEKLRMIAIAAMLADALLAVTFLFVLVNHILNPIRKLATEADREGGGRSSNNEIARLSHSVRGLIEDVDQTQSELTRSREHLLQAEKMAMVGKLAAGMAHSIRNPFTSVKMRLFSLSRSLELTDDQKEDFDVISEEIRHIDTIVQNFLEFSRPPKLKMLRTSPSTVVDSTLQLLEHRLKSYDVDIKVERKAPLSEILADSEQLKEVLVNIIVNACEAMGKGGSITIREEADSTQRSPSMAVIRVADNGPGIPASIRGKVLQPFFTTKENGTGLGLSIAARIVEEHGGKLDVVSEEGAGTTFIIALPIEEADGEHDSNHR